MTASNPLNSRDRLDTESGPVDIYRLDAVEREGLATVSRLPVSIRILLEAALRQCDGFQIEESDIRSIASWGSADAETGEIPFKPARVVMQDFTGVPAVVDLAALRSARRSASGAIRRRSIP